MASDNKMTDDFDGRVSVSEEKHEYTELEQKRIHNNKEVDMRLASVEGHIKAVRKMIEQGNDCICVVTQLLAVEKAVHKASISILRNHLNGCIKDTIGDGNENLMSDINEYNKILEKLL